MHVNKSNGKRYIGITSKPKVEHRWNSGRGYSKNPRFYSAIKKYGWDGFDHIILYENLSGDDAKDIEIRLIKEFNTQHPDCGYNMTAGGDGTQGYYPSEETRLKLSERRRKENLSEETLQRRSEGLKGRKFSDEHKAKIGKANSKAINMFDKAENFIQSFESAQNAERLIGISHTHISQCCHGIRQSAGGYIWKFA